MKKITVNKGNLTREQGLLSKYIKRDDSATKTANPNHLRDLKMDGHYFIANKKKKD